MPRIFSLIYLLLAVAPVSAQSLARIHFIPVVGTQPLVLNDRAYALPGSNDSFRISTLRFYISGIRLYHDTTFSWAEPDSYHLIDVAAPDGLSVVLSIPRGARYNRIAFNVGVDSATNTAGAGGGALDATKGMYWAWQSGYVNMKIEGTSPLCNTRKHQFQFHLGGFRGGDYCMQHVSIMLNYYSPINIQVDVAAFLKGIDLAQQAEVMSPGADAVQLSRKVPHMFFIKAEQ